MPERDINFVRTLATGGYALDCEIQQRTKKLIKSFPDVNPFLIAISQSLTWTGHAIDSENYFNQTLDFLSSGSPKILDGLSNYAGRYGPEHLRTTLYNWYKLYNELNPPINILKSTIEEIIFFQAATLDIACRARQRRRIMNIGAWLSCASFKIILCLRDELWGNYRINEVLMPLGLEVMRGVKKMIRNRYSYSRFLNEIDLSEEEGDIVRGLGTIHLIQPMCKIMAMDTNSNVLNINSGLWKFGAGDL